jgi:hypothetical protein
VASPIRPPNVAPNGAADEPGHEAEGGAGSPILAASPVPGTELLVDPVVSRAKFTRDVDQCRRLSADLRRRGWWILEAEYPNVVVAFVSPRVRPYPVVFGALINFDNYDLWAPSVRIIDPFTSKPLLHREVPAHLHFHRSVAVAQMVEIPGLGAVPAQVPAQPLLLAHSPDEVPFLCLPGIREYHEHPAHTGDDWLLHRDRGEGTLYFLLEKLARYGLEPVQQYQIGLQIVGFQRGEAPQ